MVTGCDQLGLPSGREENIQEQGAERSGVSPKSNAIDRLRVLDDKTY
jgi:hypothetical protein